MTYFEKYSKYKYGSFLEVFKNTLKSPFFLKQTFIELLPNEYHENK